MTLALGTNPKVHFLFSAATFLAGAIAVSGAPWAEETGHHHYHDSDYRHWKQPGTDLSCCSDRDCAPVKAELRDGRWWALRRSEWFDVQDDQGRGQRLASRNSEWVAVPDEKIIWVSNPTVEGGHLCYSNGMVICFVPPNTGG
jgi:hypothetical protein